MVLAFGQPIASPQDAERTRLLAQALMSQGQPQNWGQGIAALTGAFTGTQLNNRASDAEKAGQASAAEALSRIAGGGTQADIVSALSNPWLSGPQSTVASALLGQQLERSDPMYQAQLEQTQLELERMRNPQAAPMDPTSAIQNYQFLVSQGLDPVEAQGMAFGGGGTTINNMGNIPSGFEVFQDPTTGATQMRPIPGGPADLEAQAAAATEQAGDDQAAMYGGIVSEDIGRALELVESDPTFTTGVLGSVLANLGGTPANRVRNFIQTVKSNVAFDRLQAMRDSSPTGGALGAVTAPELALLEAAIGSLEQSNNADDLAYNLKRVNKMYMDTIHGEGKWESQSAGSGDGWQDMGGGIRIKPIGQ